jgi:hypothetical protein
MSETCLKEWVRAKLRSDQAAEACRKADSENDSAKSFLEKATHALISDGGVGRNISERFVRVDLVDPCIGPNGSFVVHLKWSEKDSVPKVDARIVEVEVFTA